MRVHGIMQHDNRECGVACLATICRFFGIKIPITKLREEMKVDKNGTSLYSINKEAQKYGLEPLVMQGTYNELYNDSKNRKIKLPLIVHIIKNNYECHYAILTKMHRDCVFLFDPAIGNIKISNLEFERIWSGYIISFKKSNVFKRKNLGSIIFLMGLAPNVLGYRHPAAILDRSKNKCCGLITDGEELKNNQLCFSVDTTVLHLFSDLSRTCPRTSGGWVPPLALTPKNNRSVSFLVA